MREAARAGGSKIVGEEADLEVTSELVADLEVTSELVADLEVDFDVTCELVEEEADLEVTGGDEGREFLK